MPVHCTPQSQADVPRVKHVIQIVDLDSSFDISDELLAIQCIKYAVSNDNLDFSRNNIERDVISAHFDKGLASIRFAFD